MSNLHENLEIAKFLGYETNARNGQGTWFSLIKTRENDVICLELDDNNSFKLTFYKGIIKVTSDWMGSFNMRRFIMVETQIIDIFDKVRGN